jgi:hypothetical protein
MAAHYTKAASQKRLAENAMHLVVPIQTGNEIVPLSDLVENGGTETAK